MRNGTGGAVENMLRITLALILFCFCMCPATAFTFCKMEEKKISIAIDVSVSFEKDSCFLPKGSTLGIIVAFLGDGTACQFRCIE